MDDANQALRRSALIAQLPVLPQTHRDIHDAKIAKHHLVTLLGLEG
jgi:hypothetical protein